VVLIRGTPDIRAQHRHHQFSDSPSFPPFIHNRTNSHDRPLQKSRQSSYDVAMTRGAEPPPVWSERLVGIADHGLHLFGGDYLGRPISGAAAKIPQTIEIVGERLVWSEQGHVREVDTVGLLDAFLNLA